MTQIPPCYELLYFRRSPSKRSAHQGRNAEVVPGVLCVLAKAAGILAPSASSSPTSAFCVPADPSAQLQLQRLPRLGRRTRAMTYVITQPCIGTKDASCVEVCPVDCIHATDDTDQYFINPDEC